ncbi:MAG TPA: isopentenyl-diphosphate Delta-isomerase [Nitrosopumilaceae archaeon]
MSDEFLILVDKNDNPIGLEEKMKCHLPNGKLHRAFTALLFDKEGKLVLTRRSPSKMLWPGDWDGTVASHPRKNETYISSAERRMPEEIGISCKFDYLFKFEYHVPYKNIGSENEICGTLLGLIEKSSKFNLVEDEISEIKWSSPKQLMDELQKNPEIYCPWMIIALYLLPNSEKSMISKYKSIISKWTTPEMAKSLEEAIRYHLKDNNWRLLN